MPTRRSVLAAGFGVITSRTRAAAAARPNILFAIADDQSWLHTSIAGDAVVKTPAFDRVARSGVLFTSAFTNSPGCAPSRAAILTGRGHWQLAEAGTHASYFPKTLSVYPDLLEAAGYHVGLTGKGAGPCNWRGSGWTRNPAGPAYEERKVTGLPKDLSPNDYAGNFSDFLAAKPKDRPFCFWLGAHEPHRSYVRGSGLKSGKRLEDVTVPKFLPDAPEVRSDLLDYYSEIEHFDGHLGRVLDQLEKAGELENTLVVVTADNGMSFPRAKATMYEYGIHMPLAVSWPARAKGGRTVQDLVSFVDFAPTFLEAAGVKAPATLSGRSLLPVLAANRSGYVDPARQYALAGRERHSHARRDNLGYPARAIRSREFLYIRNFAPDRMPAGDPAGYFDIDAGPTKEYLVGHRDDPAVKPFADGTFLPNPGEQLYRISTDRACLENLAGKAAFATIQQQHRNELGRVLTAESDPRLRGNGDIWESYPRFSAMRPELGGFAEEGKSNPRYQSGGR